MIMGKSRPMMGRLRVQNEIERSTREDFGSENIHILLDEIDTVHIDWTTIKFNNIATRTLSVEEYLYITNLNSLKL